MDREQVKTTSLPEKSTLWVGFNIGAGILIISFLVKFSGSIIFGGFVSESFFGELILSKTLLLVGIWLGSIFGVNYVKKRSRIDLRKVNNISMSAALLLIIFHLLWIFVNIYTLGEKFVFPTETLITTVVGAAVAFFFVRNFLKKSVESSSSDNY